MQEHQGERKDAVETYLDEMEANIEMDDGKDTNM